MSNRKEKPVEIPKSSYVITEEEGFENGIRRIINEQINDATFHLTQQPDIHQGVHDARRALKIIRAAYRLIRLDLKDEDFRYKNGFYRDVGRQFSELRDLTALLETIDMMEKHNPRMLQWKSNHAFKLDVENKRKEFEGRNTKHKIVLFLKETAIHLSEHRKQVNQFQLSKRYTRSVLASLQKVYGRGRRAFRSCKKEQDHKMMHEWRKRSKYLRYHFCMLRNVWPNILLPFEKEFHQLTDYLGDYNNLSVMKEHLLNPEYEMKPIHRLIMRNEALRHQKSLGQSALLLGEKLYAESPKTFQQRMAAYFADRKILK